MNQISELDLQNLRHLIGGFDTTHCKMEEYASKATDAQVKQFFQKSAQSAVDCKNQLMQYLQQEVPQMNEKVMVADTLAGINGELTRYGEMIPQTLKQMRNQCEMSQEEIYQIARARGYYVPAAQATREEVDHVRSVLSQG